MLDFFSEILFSLYLLCNILCVLLLDFIRQNHNQKYFLKHTTLAHYFCRWFTTLLIGHFVVMWINIISAAEFLPCYFTIIIGIFQGKDIFHKQRMSFRVFLFQIQLLILLFYVSGDLAMYRKNKIPQVKPFNNISTVYNIFLLF